ncbi:MAG: class I mannose-6-phosphate isomerase [Eubacteriales bacterium]
MNYEKRPICKISAESSEVSNGYEEILNVLKKRISEKDGKCVVAVEVYPGVRDEELIPQLQRLNPSEWINMEDCLLSEAEYAEKIRPFLTDDRVFGRMYFGTIQDFQVPVKVEHLKKRLEASDGLTVVYGFGASCLGNADLVIYADMTRWEIQLRFRKGASNFHSHNKTEDILKKYKQGYFLEWRMADKIKRLMNERLDYYLDTVRKNAPVMITGSLYRKCLSEISHRPFRTVPYFDPGVWGGQWMKKVCGLDPSAKNFAWSFDGVPEENSILFDVSGKTVEIPAMNLVLYQPKALLGEQVYARFGAEFPIRFDFLDTIDGQNLSLQVHPTTDYIHNQFGMNYTQDESYYILDANEKGCVYLGIRDETDPDEMIDALKEAQKGVVPFDAEKYVNRFPAKKHDHFLIPAGTVHCSGSGCMVLEISATPYIFTMKLWDWGRLGLDGLPRPIHIEHGEKVIQWDRRTEWVKSNLINRIRTVDSSHGYTEEHTGLHELEFIETRRVKITEEYEMNTDDNVNMLNLVEGCSAVVESPEGAFEPFEVHYAETFILPASLGRVMIRPKNCECVYVIRAFVRKPE